MGCLHWPAFSVMFLGVGIIRVICFDKSEIKKGGGNGMSMYYMYQYSDFSVREYTPIHLSS
jgi:hypothetical protein